MQLRGTVEAKAKNGAGIKIGDDWYSSFKGVGLADVNTGDTVEFEWAPDKTGKWKNIDGKTIRKVAAAQAQANAGSSGKQWNNLGVELGHASNLAMEWVLSGQSEHPADLDGWEAVTVDIFQRMKRLRAQAEAGFPDQPRVEDDGEDDSPF